MVAVYILSSIIVASLIFVLGSIYGSSKYKKKLDLLKENEEAKTLLIQSRYTSMGVTVGNIAHQWKQPLNAIGTILNNIKASIIYKGEIQSDKLLDSVNTSFTLVNHLAATIDMFYGFLASTNNLKGSFTIVQVMDKIKKFTEYSFENSKIELKFNIHANPKIIGSENEFTHVLLNILLNAKDALDNTNTQKPEITIDVVSSNVFCTISVSDNGGGITQKPLQKIFELNNSSKNEGMGLGLYIAKKIIQEHFGGTINVKNSDKGAVFTLIVPLKDQQKEISDKLSLDEMGTLTHFKQLSQKVMELEDVEKTLRQWEEVFNQAHWAITFHKGESFKFEMVNPAFLKMYGYTQEEIKNIDLRNVIAPESLAVLKKRYIRGFEDSFISMELVHMRKDGTKFPVNVDLTFIRNNSGDILYYIANMRDISKQKEEKKELLLKTFALEHVQDRIFLIDKNGKFQYVNEGACNSLGYTKAELLTLGVEDIDPNWSNKIWLKAWEVLKKTKTKNVEVCHQRKNGTLTPPLEIEANYFVYEGEEYNLAIGRDLQERKEIEKRKENEKMRLFFEKQLVGMAILSPAKGWLHVNEKLCNLLGYTFEELKNISWEDLTHPDDLIEEMALYTKLLDGDIEHYFYEKRYIKKGGDIIYVNLSIGCVRKNNGEIDYVIATIKDISENKKIVEQMNNLNATLEQKIKERTKELELLEIAINSTSEAIYITPSSNDYILYVNDIACEMLGYTKEELLAMKIQEIDVLQQKSDLKNLKNRADQGEKFTIQSQQRKKDGTVIDVDVKVSAFQFDGVYMGIAVVKELKS